MFTLENKFFLSCYYMCMSDSSASDSVQPKMSPSISRTSIVLLIGDGIQR